MSQSQTVMMDLELTRKRLDYFLQQKEKSPVMTKWIEIYSTRIQKLEKQAAKLGLSKPASKRLH